MAVTWVRRDDCGQQGNERDAGSQRLPYEPALRRGPQHLLWPRLDSFGNGFAYLAEARYRSSGCPDMKYQYQDKQDYAEHGTAGQTSSVTLCRVGIRRVVPQLQKDNPSNRNDCKNCGQKQSDWGNHSAEWHMTTFHSLRSPHQPCPPTPAAGDAALMAPPIMFASIHHHGVTTLWAIPA